MDHTAVISASQFEELTTREALAILGLRDPSSISHLVAQSKLTPARKLPGRNGAYLFRREDVVALAAERAAEAERAAKRAAIFAEAERLAAEV